MAKIITANTPKISAISTTVPPKKITNDYFSYLMDDKDLKRSVDMIGVQERYWAESNISTADLCINSAQKIFNDTECDKNSIDAIILVTQTPNYQIPATSYYIHQQLELDESILSFDVNLGCSGYIYGLYLASSLLENGVNRVLLLAGETSSKIIDFNDPGTAILFGDAGSATLIESSTSKFKSNFLFQSRGSGLEAISIPCGISKSINSEKKLKDKLSMNGPDVFNFTIKEIPSFLELHGNSLDIKIGDFDKILLHQANRFMLNHIYKKIGASEDQRVININKFGNTSSATIPLLLTDPESGDLQNKHILMAGFGVGLSWASMDIRFNDACYKNHNLMVL